MKGPHCASDSPNFANYHPNKAPHVRAPSKTPSRPVSPPVALSRPCRVCGTAFMPTAAQARFCKRACRDEFDNRRKTRGAILYDLFMAQRYERELFKALGVWAIMCRAAYEWRQEDNAERAGRKSWHGPHAAIAKLTHLFANTLVRGRQ